MDYHKNQCEIVEHQIDNPELFHNLYPYEEFERYQLPNLEKESLKFYNGQLKFAENDRPLAYYFFEHRNLSKDVKTGIRTVYKQFTEKHNSFTLVNLKNHFANLDITNNKTSSGLSSDWERMKRVSICSFGIKKEDFPKIKFSSSKQGREENVSAINTNQYLKAANLLYEKGEYEDSLLINTTWCFASRPSEMLTLRFEGFEDKDNQKSVYYYANKKNQGNKITISNYLYDRVMEFKEMKISQGTYTKKMIITPTGKSIKGYLFLTLRDLFFKRSLQESLESLFQV